MNLEIRVRCVYLKYVEKELKVLLIPAGPDSYTLPQGVQPEITKALQNNIDDAVTLRDQDKPFAGLINRVPHLMWDEQVEHLAFDFYVLARGDFKLAHLKNHTWFHLEEVAVLNAELSSVLADTLQRLKEELNYQPIEYHLLPKTFTIPELLRLYELILNRKLDRANFFRKITVLDILQSAGSKRKGKMYRSPMLYTFNENYFQKAQKGLFKEF